MCNDRLDAVGRRCGEAKVEIKEKGDRKEVKEEDIEREPGGPGPSGLLSTFLVCLLLFDQDQDLIL